MGDLARTVTQNTLTGMWTGKTAHDISNGNEDSIGNWTRDYSCFICVK